MGAYRLFVVSTKVGGVPEVLPSHMINYAIPEEDGKYFFRNNDKLT